MPEVHISKIPDLHIVLNNQKSTLPDAVRKKINRHWEKLVKANPHLHNGEVFTITSVSEGGGRTRITLAETNYAHFLYSQQIGGLGEYAVRVIHPATLVVSKDRHFIFGSMGPHTSRPGIIQCCGGGIDFSDIHDGIVDVGHSVSKELAEELGLDTNDSTRVASCYSAYLKSGGPAGNMTAVYVLHLKQTSQEFLRDYERFAQLLKRRGEEPEFDMVYAVPASADSVEAFISQHKDTLHDYMAIMLRQAQKDVGQG